VRTDPERRAGVALVAVLAGLVAVAVPELGSDAWTFRGAPNAHAHGRFDLGAMRSIAVLCGVLVLCTAPFLYARYRPRLAVAVTVLVCAGLVLPATVLQVGLRDATAPWVNVNDATYQIEIAGDLVLHGHDPYGHDYDGSGLERFYASAVGSDPTRVALEHFAYFPGMPEVAAAWRLLPGPLDDVRLLVALTTLGLLGAALLFPGPLEARLAVGAALAANPLAIRGAWFGVADGPVLLALVLAVAAVVRRRPALAGMALGVAVLLKQFGLVAIPFLVVLALLEGSRRDARRLLVACGATIVVGALPFLVAGPSALWDDTIAYGTGTYRIIGYGLAALLERAGIVHGRTGSYPFDVLALVVWLPATAWAVRAALRSREPWTCAAGLAGSFFLLFFIARVFQSTYLVYPLAAGLCAVLLALREDQRGSNA
jgi:Glycosyltransferase family 87